MKIFKPFMALFIGLSDAARDFYIYPMQSKIHTDTARTFLGNSESS